MRGTFLLDRRDLAAIARFIDRAVDHAADEFEDGLADHPNRIAEAKTYSRRQRHPAPHRNKRPGAEAPADPFPAADVNPHVLFPVLGADPQPDFSAVASGFFRSPSGCILAETTCIPG
jgi:hypothetical protein